MLGLCSVAADRGCRLSVTRLDSANQNANVTPREKPEEWPPCLTHKLKYGNIAKDLWVPNQTFKISHGARSLNSRDSCDQTRQITFYLNAELRHQGLDRPGVPQVPEGTGEQGEMEETGCEIICGAPTTLAVNE